MQAATADDCQDGSEICSPFCVCSCCSVPASYQHFTVSNAEPKVVMVNAEPNFEYTAPFSGSFQTSVWQPPKR